MLLTRLPVGWLAEAEAPPAACVWAYPLVGAVVGLVGAAVFALARLGLPPAVAAILAVGAGVLVTGGLHEDGLADTADGFGGGRTSARKLEIMHDSRIGSFGAVALILTLALRATALAALAEPRSAAPVLIASGALGRGAMLMVLWRLAPARSGGLAAPLASTARRTMGLGFLLAAGFGLLAPGGLLAALLAGAGMAALARRQVGGYTGDVLGATQQAAECMVLLAALASWQ